MRSDLPGNSTNAKLRVPPNVSFRVDDLESVWLKPKDHFEYVHARHTVMAIRNWPLLLSRVYE